MPIRQIDEIIFENEFEKTKLLAKNKRYKTKKVHF